MNAAPQKKKEREGKKKWSSFRGLFFREQPSESFREDSGESTVHEPFSDTDWWCAGQRKKHFDLFVAQGVGQPACVLQHSWFFSL